MYGGDMIEKVTCEKSTWNELPWKFEAGTPNIAGGIGLGAAVDYLCKVGLDPIMNHEKELLSYGLDKMSEHDWINIYGHKGDSESLGVISFNVDGVHPHDVAGILDEEGIAVRSGHHCAQPLMHELSMDFTARVSFYLYNNKDEIDLLVDTLKRVKKLFG